MQTRGPIEHQELLEKEVLAHINIEEFYQGYKLKVGEHNLCLVHKDTTPSLEIRRDGSFKCWSTACKLGDGANVIPFYQEVERKDKKQALLDLYNKYVSPIVPYEHILKYHSDLKNNKEFLEKLLKDRPWDQRLLDKYFIGVIDNKLLLPLVNKWGFVTSALVYNVFGVDGEHKYKPIRKGMATQVLFPYTSLAYDTILFVEGYSDVLSALSKEFAAITSGSAGHWQKSYSDLFIGKNVIIIPHRDEAGKVGAEKIAQNMSGKASSIKIVDLYYVKDTSKDLTDWFNEGHTAKDLVKLASDTKYYDPPVDVNELPVTKNIIKGEHVNLRFKELFNDDNYNKKVRFQADVIGRAEELFYLPDKVQITCEDSRNSKKACKICSLRNLGTRLFEFDKYNKDIIQFTECSIDQQRNRIIRICSVGKHCQTKLDVVSNLAVDRLILCQRINPQKPEAQTLQLPAYYVGKPLEINRAYQFEGHLVSNPKDSSIGIVLTEGKSVQSTLDTFTLTTEIRDRLAQFQTNNVMEKLEDIYQHYAERLTHIKGRFIAHAAIDLPFFSPLVFDFLGEDVIGPLDILVYGDTRCGKTKIAKTLIQHYNMGEMVSGENISFMNLTAGISLAHKFRSVRFGRLVMNHRGTLVIDEVSAMSYDVLGKMSRARSEGVVDFDKDGKHQKAPALTSKIWLSNPRDNRQMRTFSHGVEALLRLFSAPEDISRFDYVTAVRTNEIDTDIINQQTNGAVMERYLGPDSTNLICWVKTRRREDIEFTTASIRLILDSASKFGKKYTQIVPLVQIENFRIKLAKIAASIAARVYRCNKAGDRLIIDEECVDVACKLIKTMYASKALGYEEYSRIQNKYDNIDKGKILDVFMRLYKVSQSFEFKRFIDDILDNNYITKEDIECYASVDKLTATKVLHLLVREKCLKKKKNQYVKTSTFIDTLKQFRVMSGEDIIIAREKSKEARDLS
jgi:hypothetical protein